MEQSAKPSGNCKVSQITSQS